jgi:hypothetical protein
MRVSTWTAATLVWILLASGACLTRLIAQTSAQSAEPAAADKAGKELHALRISANPTAIRVDGRIDDEGWMRAPVISDLTQEDPDNMMAPTESTTVRVAYDDRYVYVAVQMAMHDVAELRDGFGRRGSAPPSDRVLIAFDTAHDHQNAYVFEVNASGVQNDYLDVGDTGTNNDYEAVWEVVTLQTGQGWNAEFRIPFSQMRFPSQDTQTVWGFNIRRDVFARGEQDWWVARPRGAQGVVSRFGHAVVTHAPIDGVVRNGFGGVLNSEYTTKYYNVNGHLDRFSPSFRNSDMGFFFARPDKNEAGGGVFLYQPDPKWFIRSSMLNVYGGRQWNDDHLPTNGWNGINGSVNFTNFWNVFIGLTRRPSQYDDVGSRGGPPILMSKASWVNISIDSDSRKQWGGGLRVFAFHNAFGGYSTQIEPNVRLQPSRQVVATVGVGLTSSLDDAQWIKNIDADGDATEDNVYGTLRRHEINITTRGTYSFTRDLTVEAYVQPFVAVGNYFDIRKLARPMSYEFTPVTLADDPDFNKKSVRGTIVLRWEYVRGSTLFMVWNLATSDEETRKGIYAPWRDLRGAFGAPATNTLAIKLSYWFAP